MLFELRRVGGTAFRVGFAEMNGWRPSMEDAHAKKENTEEKRKSYTYYINLYDI